MPKLQIGPIVDLPGDLLWDDGQLPTSKLLKLLPRETSLFQPDKKESTRHNRMAQVSSSMQGELCGQQRRGLSFRAHQRKQVKVKEFWSDHHWGSRCSPPFQLLGRSRRNPNFLSSSSESHASGTIHYQFNTPQSFHLLWLDTS